MSTHIAKKRFGQNFLHDANIIQKIIRAIQPQPNDQLIEIGPGLGALTLPLLETGARLTAVEIDPDLQRHWQQYAQEHNLKQAPARFALLPQDALTVNYAQLRESSLQPEQPLRIVGNLPYNISTPLLFSFLQHAEHIQDIHVMLQKEVVDRMAAKPGNKTYGRLTVMLASQCQVQPLFLVKPDCFKPAPKVDSAVVRLIPQAEARFAFGDAKCFSAIVSAAFNQRRKTLRNTLKTLCSDEALEQAFAEVGIEGRCRAETLSPEQFGGLSVALSSVMLATD